MSYQLKRINPFWHVHPLIPVAVAAGAALGAAAMVTQKTNLAIVGAVVAGLGVLAGARPVISAVLLTLGLFGGAVTFLILPNPNTVGMSLAMRALSTVLFAGFYMVLMDALVLVVAVLYNLFAGVLGLGGVMLEFEEAPEEGQEA